MDTLKVLIKLMKEFGRANPLISYTLHGHTIHMQAYGFEGQPVGKPLTINSENCSPETLDAVLDKWIANGFSI